MRRGSPSRIHSIEKLRYERVASSARPTVSIIVPLYNKVDYIGQTIESALGQDFRDFEIIVIDDGSTDGSSEVARGYAEQLTYVRQERAGVGAARNRGMRLATGDLLAFLDADDPWARTKLGWQVRFMNSHPDVDWCATNYWVQAPGAFESVPAVPYAGPPNEKEWLIIDWFEAMAADAIAFQTSGVMVRKSLIERVGQFDETIPSGQDFDYWVRIAETTPRCGYCLTPCYSFSRDSRYSITYTETRKYAAKAGMLTRFIQRSTQPNRPRAYQDLIKLTCEDIIRGAIVQGHPEVARSILDDFPPEWRSLRHYGYALLSYVPTSVVRFFGRLAGRRLPAPHDDS